MSLVQAESRHEIYTLLKANLVTYFTSSEIREMAQNEAYKLYRLYSYAGMKIDPCGVVYSHYTKDIPVNEFWNLVAYDMEDKIVLSWNEFILGTPYGRMRYMG